MSYYSEWIDETIRDGYENAPTSKAEVQTSILENDDIISYTYFLLEFTGQRDNILENITLNYMTRDGTAHSGEDETFYLDITNPSYGDFGENTTLTGVRTIIDDDFTIT